MSDRPTDEQLRECISDGLVPCDYAHPSVITEWAAELLELRKQLTAAKAVCDASRRHHNRDYHMMKKWADECDLCIAHKEFRAAMKEGVE